MSDNWKTDPKHFDDMPDCKDEDFVAIVAQMLSTNTEIGMLKTSFLMARMMICMTKMRKEIKKLKTQDLETSNN